MNRFQRGRTRWREKCLYYSIKHIRVSTEKRFDRKIEQVEVKIKSFQGRTEHLICILVCL